MGVCRGNLKLLTVLGGIALALAPCLQQGHGLCHLSEFVSSLMTTCNDEAKTSCCSHAASSATKQQAPQHHDLPCEHKCWCCEAPNPSVTPRDATEATRLLVSAIAVSTPATARLPLLVERPAIHAFGRSCFFEASSSALCAQLCRYLI
jgi:hypothetical protein